MSLNQPLPVAASGNPERSARSAAGGNASAPSHAAARERRQVQVRLAGPGRQHPACTATPRMPLGAACGSPHTQRAGVTPPSPCTPHTLLYLLALEANKIIAKHDPAERGQKGHGGARRWEDPEISTSSETPRVCVQALSSAPHGCRQQAGLVQPPRSQGRIPPTPRSARQAGKRAQQRQIYSGGYRVQPIQVEAEAGLFHSRTWGPRQGPAVGPH